MLEGIPAPLADIITRAVSVPTIGIGAGAGCDGQVLVTHDLLGLYDRFVPSFVKQYADLAAAMRGAFEAYRDDVRARTFPAAEHEFSLSDEVLQALRAHLDAPETE